MSGTNARRILGVFLTGFVAAWSLGCSEDGPSDSGADPTAEMGIDLSQGDGGMGVEDEAPGFGDDYFGRYLDEDEEALDPLENDEDFRGLEGDARADVFFVRVTWGNLAAGPDESENDETADVVYDWTGGAMVSDGILVPKRVLRFERRDHLVRPDRDRQKVEWVSHTSTHWDGVLLQIVVPSPADTTLHNMRRNTNGDGLTPDDLFTFSAPEMGVELSYPLADMAEIDETVMVDGEIGVTFEGFTREDLGDHCPKGPMAGAWVKVPDDSLSGGYFRAHWTNALGGLFGHVRGRWGVTAEGEQLFVGKIIGRHGEYLGHMRGTWEASVEDPNQGAFAGGWVVLNRNGDVRAMGGVRGGWAIGEDGEHGRLRGMWAKDCEDDGEEDEDDGEERP